MFTMSTNSAQHNAGPSSLVSSRRLSQTLLLLACTIAGGNYFPSLAMAQGVSVEQILKYRPVQPGVEYDIPASDEIAKCTVKVEKSQKGSGWAVLGPAGQPLRRFVDTDGDNVVDQWRYFQHGLEVYRDIDTNANNEVDQSRWLNAGGSRWGVDQNEDGKIDRWLRISAEEASREAVMAMATNNIAGLTATLIDAQDIKALGIESRLASQILEGVQDPATKVRELTSRSKVLTKGASWIRFDSSMLMPSVIPREDGKATRDMLVYENVMAIMQIGTETGFVQVGEMVQVGDVWKLTSIPQPIEPGQTDIAFATLLMNPATQGAGPEVGGQLSEETRLLIGQLEELDKRAPGPTAPKEEAIRYHTMRSSYLAKLATAAGTDATDRDMWQRQRVDGISAAVQMNLYPNGLAELQQIEEEYRQKYPNSELLPYTLFQRKGAEYSLQAQTADAESRAKLQTAWIAHLEEFVRDYPKAENAADALLQLGVSQEFAGNADAAKKTYERLVSDFPQAPTAVRGQGSLRRLNLPGGPLPLTGKLMGGGTADARQYRGKVLVVVYWATWCEPFTKELPQLIELYSTYRREGFEVLGVNVDTEGAPVQQYLQQYKMPWPNIAEEGGLESRPAQEFGIITMPTMFLVGQDGRVLSTALSIEDLKKQLGELLKK
ncbi:MAG: thioredoxin-like domain-containing protein [Planctomycetaceae bacterium]